MTEVNYPVGRTAFYKGAMDNVGEKARQIRIIEIASFATLTPNFQYTPPSPDSALQDTAADATMLTFPPLYILHNIKSFKLTSGTIEVIYSN